MKKSFIVLLVFSIFSLSLFGQNSINNEDFNLTQKVIKVGEEDKSSSISFDSKVFNIHYEIKENTKDNSYILCLSDDSKDNFQMRVYVSNKAEIYTWYFDIEATLFDMFLDSKDDEEVINLIKENPIFFTIVAYYNRNNDFVEDEETSTFFYMIDDRQ